MSLATSLYNWGGRRRAPAVRFDEEYNYKTAPENLSSADGVSYVLRAYHKMIFGKERLQLNLNPRPFTTRFSKSGPRVALLYTANAVRQRQIRSLRDAARN